MDEMEILSKYLDTLIIVQIDLTEKDRDAIVPILKIKVSEYLDRIQKEIDKVEKDLYEQVKQLPKEQGLKHKVERVRLYMRRYINENKK